MKVRARTIPILRSREIRRVGLGHLAEIRANLDAIRLRRTRTLDRTALTDRTALRWRVDVVVTTIAKRANFGWTTWVVGARSDPQRLWRMKIVRRVRHAHGLDGFVHRFHLLPGEDRATPGAVVAGITGRRQLFTSLDTDVVVEARVSWVCWATEIEVAIKEIGITTVGDGEEHRRGETDEEDDFSAHGFDRVTDKPSEGQESRHAKPSDKR